MSFLAGLILGLVLGACFGLLILALCFSSARREREYESEKNL